ncbi:MAG TPA: rhamnulokinase family protein [Methylomirabilota bacterium]|nr:rhamnulokinase family protein [Methylomirabilota bacterium]
MATGRCWKPVLEITGLKAGSREIFEQAGLGDFGNERERMKEQCYLGVDLGAESGRVMAGFWNGKRIRLQELHRFSNGPVEIGSRLRWDVLRLWAEVQQGLTLAARACGRMVRSVGVDTWGVDSVLLSKSNELVCQPFHYRDGRTHGMMNAAFRRVPREQIFAATGLQFMELNTLYQMLALQKDSPEILEAADCLLMMPDFFHWCLSGRRVAEFTEATTTQFFDPVKRTWAHALLRRFGLPTQILPKVVSPGRRIGSLLEPIQRLTGLGKIGVVVPASHDTGSAVAAVPASAEEEGSWAYLSSGTWSLMGLEVRKARVSKRVLELNLTNEGGVDGTYRLLKNITGMWLVQQCKRAFEAKGKKLEYAELVHLAREARPLRSLIDPDHASFGNPADMPRAMKEFCQGTGQPAPDSQGALVRCALESLALRYQAVLENLEEIGGRRVEVIHIVGGGSRNAMLNQFTADACNRRVIAGPVEATALGNVLVQARAAGELDSLAELREVVRKSYEVKVFEPRRDQVGRWQEARGRFAALQKRKGLD